jgi:hypothetical protein
MGHDDDQGVGEQWVAAISIPADSLIPDPRDGRSTAAEYDLYFRIVHDQQGLRQWTQTCVTTLDAQLADLRLAALSPEQRCQILEGMLLVYQATLARWLECGEAAERQARP